MRRIPPILATSAVLALTLLAAAGPGALAQAGPRPGADTMSPAARAAADSGRPAFNQADVRFMSGMIDHHAQAVLIAGWAPSHGASASVRALCERIVVGQRDEIGLMQRWLRERRQAVPDGGPAHAHLMPDMDHPMLMPGMLTADQLAELDRARGADFDRLFLRDMIQHHQGALTMVSDLLAAPGSTEDDLVFKYASDVNADQSTEIARMQRMLDAMPGERNP